jgi:hypothetical protein
MVHVVLLQPRKQKTLLVTQAGKVYVIVPGTLLRSAFGDDWQQAGFKVQLSVFKDGARAAGGRVAAQQGPCAADETH